jgi:hypothetical protein
VGKFPTILKADYPERENIGQGHISLAKAPLRSTAAGALQVIRLSRVAAFLAILVLIAAYISVFRTSADWRPGLDSIQSKTEGQAAFASVTEARGLQTSSDAYASDEEAPAAGDLWDDCDPNDIM